MGAHKNWLNYYVSISEIFYLITAVKNIIINTTRLTYGVL